MRVAIVGGVLIVAVACAWWFLGGRVAPNRAEPPGAATAPPPAPSARPAPTRAGTLDVRVVRPDGTGVEAVPVVLAVRDREVARVPTGAAGWARFTGRTERELSVRLKPSGVTLAIGTFRPADGDLTLRHVLHAPRSLVIRVFAEGQRKLPEAYCVARPQLFAVRTEKGEISGRFHPRSTDRVEVWLQAPGFVDGGGRAEASLRTDPAIATIRLRRVVSLSLRATGPAGIADHLTLEQHDGSWREANASVTIHSDRVAYDLAPGLYRVVLSGTRAVIAEFDLDGPLDLDLDLTRAEWLAIHVDVPRGYDLASVAVLARSGAEEHYLPRHRHRQGWTYAVFLPGDRTFSIRPSHPLLVPVKTLETDRGGTVTLRMRPGPLLRFRIAHEWWPGVYTLLYRPGDLERPVFDGFARRLPGRTKTCGLTGWEPGTYSVFVHFRDHVPVLRHVTIPAEGLDLGTLPQERGSWVRVSAYGTRPWIRVESLDLPRIRRRERGHSPVVAKGLPAGRYRLRFGAGGKEFEEEIDLDGKTDLEREVDLR